MSVSARHGEGKGRAPRRRPRSPPTPRLLSLSLTRLLLPPQTTQTGELQAEVRREFEAARAASQRRRQQQQQKQPGQEPAPGAAEAAAATAGSGRRRPLPPPLAAAAGDDEDAYATKKALSDGREALKRLRDMIEHRR